METTYYRLCARIRRSNWRRPERFALHGISGAPPQPPSRLYELIETAELLSLSGLNPGIYATDVRTDSGRKRLLLQGLLAALALLKCPVPAVGPFQVDLESAG